MTTRDVTVRLKLVARQYTQGADEGVRASKRLARSQHEMAAAARASGVELDRAARKAVLTARQNAAAAKQNEESAKRTKRSSKKAADEVEASAARAGRAAKKAAGDIEDAAARVERAGRRSGRGLLYAAAGVAALGAAGGAVKTLPPLIAATGVAAATLPPMLFGAANAGGVLVTSLKGVGAAMGEVLDVDDPFVPLGRNARGMVAEVKRLQPEMRGFRQELQDRTLANGARNLNLLATQVLPRLRSQMGGLADEWGEAFDQITEAALDPRFTRAFNTAGRGAAWFMDLLNARIPSTVRTVSTLVESADPLARAFGQSLINSLDRFNGAVERASRSGSLQEFFDRGGRSASAFMDIVGDVLTITGMVVREAQQANGTFAATQAALSRYIATGRAQADMAGIVNTLTTSYEGLKDVLGPLGAIARDAVADPATADALRTMFDVMAAGAQVLQLLFGLFQSLPGPMQTAVLVAIALGIAVSKLTKALALMQVAAGKAAAQLTATGAAGARAGRGLNAAAAGAGKATAALVGLQLAGIVLDQFVGRAPDIEQLNRALEEYAAKGRVTGEMSRLFGADLDEMGKAANFASDGWIPKFSRGVEGLLPPVKSLNELFYGDSFTGGAEKFAALDASIAQFAKNTGNYTATADLWRQVLAQSGLDAAELARLMPAAYAEMARLGEAAHSSGSGLAANSERSKALAGSFREASLAGKDLAATMDLINGKTISAVEGQIKLEAAYDDARDVVDEYGRVTKKGTNEINLSSEAGRKSMAALIGIQQAATQAADAEAKRTGNTAAGIPILNAARQRFVDLAAEMTGSRKAALALAGELFAIPDKDVEVTVDTAKGQTDLETLGYTVKRLPNGKLVIVKANTAEAKRRLDEAKAAVDRINSKTVTVTVRTVLPSGDIRVGHGSRGGGTHLRAHGGVSVPYGRPVAAAMGLVRPDIYPASDPPLYQFAERETGGELFLPRRGIDRERGRALLAIGAAWYGGRFVPMRRGGILAAQSGLVNVAPPAPAPPAPERATRLDYAEAYLRSRDAVAALNKSLKENGRSFSVATAKGRENRAAVYASINAAQEAARVKFEETGSVKAANAVYDSHIKRLRATLKQQKVNAGTIKELMKLAQRPSFTVPPKPSKAPTNSADNVAAARANITAQAGIGELGDQLSLHRAGVDITTEHGRANLTAILDFLGAAEAAAQAVYRQTKSKKKATTTYDGYIAQLRKTLGGAGYSKKTIEDLLKTYGRITLEMNATGGVYMAATGGLGALGGLSQAAIYQRPMYGWAEKRTGGELFVPRLGSRERAERLLSIGAGWYGGKYVRAGAGGGGATTINNNLTVHALRADLSSAELQGLMRQMDVQARVGRRK